jgi:ATP/maltotriose-dependent transcriptional regulator MalT
MLDMPPPGRLDDWGGFNRSCAEAVDTMTVRSVTREPSGVDAVRAAFEYRIAIIQAVAGAGKTTAVRAALGGLQHVWHDPKTQGIDELVAAVSSGSPLIVVDDLHVIAAGDIDRIASFVGGFPATRWIFVSRESVGLPMAAWVAVGQAGAPVGQRDLSLSLHEIRRAAKTLGMRVDDSAMQFVTDATGGWPVAVRFALAALQRSTLDLSRAAATAERLLFSYFSTEILSRLDDDRRYLVSELALLGAFDETMLAAAGREDAPADLRWLSDAPVPSHEEADRVVLHPAFARYAIAQIPASQRRARALRVAAVLRVSGFAGRAFDLVRRYAPDCVLAELHAGGLALFDAGCARGVGDALRALPQSVRRDDPIVVCLRAEIEAQAGALGRANALYERANQIETTREIHARVCRLRAVHYLNQGSTEALAAIVPAFDVGTEVDRADARGIYAMALALAGRLDEAHLEAARAVRAATDLDDEALLARSLQRLSYVQYQSGNAAAAEGNATEAARLAHRAGAWFHFICAQSILYGTAVGTRDDHAAALWHAQQMASAAERTGDRRHRLYALSAQYCLEVERGHDDRALAIESEMQLHSGFRDELDCCIAMATRLSWNGEFSVGYRVLAKLDDRVVDPAERRLWNASLAMFAAFGGDEKNALLRLRACGRIAAPAARENAIGNVQADCFAAIAQITLGNTEAAMRRLPHHAPTAQTRALVTFVRDLAALGSSLNGESASRALKRLRSAHQEGIAEAIAVALASLHREDVPTLLTDAETRVLVELADGRTAKAIAQQHARSIHTVRNQIKAVTRKLGASGIIEAVARARDKGLLH